MPLRYFIPDWDDRVDPGYNFAADMHTADRNPYKDDVYAHEIYTPAPYDGILLSLATLYGSKAKREAIETAGTVHRYLRLPEDGVHKVLGDCGAFTYFQEKDPPYTTENVLETYHSLGFDLGVSIDHLIFTELESEKERRWNITVENAREFLRLYKHGNYSFTPVGVVQGWDAASYQRGTKALMEMGYEYIAIGGLVRSTVPEIIRTLQAVQEALLPGVEVHLFGVTRPEYATKFASLGVTSFDSASRLRRAWMDGRQNYFLNDEAFTAIRIPDAKKVASEHKLDEAMVRQMEQRALDAIRSYARDEISVDDTLPAIVSYAKLSNIRIPDAEEVSTENNLDEAQVRQMEQTALDAVQSFSRGEISIDDALAVILPYAKLSKRLKKDKFSLRDKQAYRKTLEARPWLRCECDICQEIKVEVIIFRGNNRNRRRGFHNTWQLYVQLRTIEAAGLQPATSQMEMSV